MFQENPGWEERLDNFGQCFLGLKNSVPFIKNRLRSGKKGIITVSPTVAPHVLQALWKRNFSATVISVTDGRNKDMVKIHIQLPHRSRGQQKTLQEKKKTQQRALEALRAALQS